MINYRIEMKDHHSSQEAQTKIDGLVHYNTVDNSMDNSGQQGQQGHILNSNYSNQIVNNKDATPVFSK